MLGGYPSLILPGLGFRRRASGSTNSEAAWLMTNYTKPAFRSPAGWIGMVRYWLTSAVNENIASGGLSSQVR
jgi:hypothetical protein